MLLRYYKQNELAFSNRKRYLNLSIFGNDYTEEEQRKVTFGDGARTSIKTSISNACNYVVMIDGDIVTRWYVVNYAYLNGSQISMNLQRDVIGENGVDKMFGKIERGWTDSLLKYRKELSLNQRLVERTPLKPDTYQYGNFSVNTHDNEAWGILYLVKPDSTQQVAIDGFTPQFYEGNAPSINTTYGYIAESDIVQKFIIGIDDELEYLGEYEVTITYKYNTLTNTYYGIKEYKFRDYPNSNTKKWTYKMNILPNADKEAKLNLWLDWVISSTINGDFNGFYTPFLGSSLDYSDTDFSNRIYYDSGEGKYYKYYSHYQSEQSINGTVNSYSLRVQLEHRDHANSYAVYTFGQNEVIASSQITIRYCYYTREELNPSESGSVVINPNSTNIIDEPFVILAFPLYNVTITGDNEEYEVQRDNAFYIFNNIIEKLSGENGWVVDAQVYPYCPDLLTVNTTLTKEEGGEILFSYPIFNIMQNNYIRSCSVKLYPNVDVKKEYIQRQYSVVSPDQSDKFTFNYYDYNVETDDQISGNVNVSNQQFLIKTCLKPFAILTSCVVVPSNNSLMGITYESDLRGCKPSSNGFECSLSSDAFETYRRQNSNYQQIFNLQKNELQKQQEVERVNEAVSGIVNTTTAAAMGAIGGASMGGVAGGVIGSVAAGATVGAAQIVQYSTNEELREYERYLQQQNFDLTIGTIKNLPDTITRVSSFNEIVLKDFYYVVETYECSEQEKEVVDTFVEKYGYGIGVYGDFAYFNKDKWFLRGTLITSELMPNLHNIAQKELNGGIYIYE